MLMTLAVLYIYFMRWRRKRSEAMRNHQLVKNVCACLRYSSVSLRKRGLHLVLDSDKVSSSSWSRILEGSASRDPANVKVLCETTDYHICAIEPRFSVSLKGWTRFPANVHQSDFLAEADRSKDVFYLILEMLKVKKDDETADVQCILQNTKLKDLVHLVAWKSGHLSFEIVAECVENGFSDLTQSFMKNTLLAEDLLQVTSVTSIDVSGEPDDLVSKTKSPLRSSPMPSPLKQLQKTIASESISLPVNDYTTNDHLEFSSNQSLPYPYQVDQKRGEELSETYSDSDCAGEAPAEPLEDVAPEMLTPITRKSNLQGKPPNVLVYCGKKDSARLFENVRSVFAQCLNTDRYTIYHLKHDNVKTTPWLENTTLLIISSDKVYDGVDDVFLRYFHGGGTVVSFGSSFDAKFVRRVQTNSKRSILKLCYEHWNDAAFICGRHVYEQNLGSLLYDVTLTAVATEKQKGCPVILEAVHETSGGVALLSQVNLDKDPSEMAISIDIFTILKQSNAYRFEILRSLFSRLGIDCDQPNLPALTPIILLTTSAAGKQTFLNSLTSRLKDGHLVSKEVTLQFLRDSSDSSSLNITSSTIPVLTEAKNGRAMFNYAVYKANLKTKVLGNTLLYADVVTTTMNLFEGLMFSVSSETGLVAIARQQTAGLGRGGNVWLSPPGCAMFSIHVRVPATSWLGERIPFLQHIMSLAVVLAVRTKPGYEDIDIRIKWPNDVYFGATMKLGGILVKSSIMHNTIHANIGCGVNVANKDPTMCINDLVQIANECAPHGESQLNLLTVEEVIARSITALEELIATFQTNGPEDFKKRYYKYWLHSDQSVRLNTEDGPQATVVGLDDYGFLVVRRSNGGQMESVQPDGNSFDMMRNLIAPKSN